MNVSMGTPFDPCHVHLTVGVLYLPPKPARLGGRSSLSNLVPTPEDIPPQTLRPSSSPDDSMSEPDQDDQVIAPARSLAMTCLLRQFFSDLGSARKCIIALYFQRACVLHPSSSLSLNNLILLSKCTSDSSALQASTLKRASKRQKLLHHLP